MKYINRNHLLVTSLLCVTAIVFFSLLSNRNDNDIPQSKLVSETENPRYAWLWEYVDKPTSNEDAFPVLYQLSAQLAESDDLNIDAVESALRSTRNMMYFRGVLTDRSASKSTTMPTPKGIREYNPYAVKSVYKYNGNEFDSALFIEIYFSAKNLSDKYETEGNFEQQLAIGESLAVLGVLIGSNDNTMILQGSNLQGSLFRTGLYIIEKAFTNMKMTDESALVSKKIAAELQWFQKLRSKSNTEKDQ